MLAIDCCGAFMFSFLAASTVGEKFTHTFLSSFPHFLPFSCPLYLEYHRT